MATNPNIKKRRGFRALGSELLGLTRRAYGRRGFSSGAILRDWPDIVGTHLANRCQPDRISFPRGKRDGGTLYLRTPSGAEALELQHLSPLIIERVNSHFGYGAVAQMKLEPGFRPQMKDQGAKPPRSLSQEEEARLDAQLSQIQDDGLRAALGRLGKAIARKNPGPQ